MENNHVRRWLCVATPDPDAIPETYVRQHIRHIAPEHTVVLYFRGNGQTIQDLPHFRVPTYHPASSVHRYLVDIFRLLQYGYPGAISGTAAEGVKEFLHAHSVRVVLAEFGPTGCALLPICRDLGLRLVVHFHGHDGTVLPRRWVYRHAYRVLNRYADAIVCGSGYFRGRLIQIGFDERKLHVIPLGIEVEQFVSDAKKDPNLVIAVGRFVAVKAPHLTIQAFERVLERCPDARLEMIGDGPLLPMCKEMVKAKGIEGHVIFHGAQPHEFVKERLARASVFVQHSITAPNGASESLGISLLEAMASKVPVVATRHGGFVETVIEGVTGFLVDEGDVKGMAERVIQLLQDEKLRFRMGEAGRQRVEEHYEAKVQAQRLYSLLRI